MIIEALMCDGLSELARCSLQDRNLRRGPSEGVSTDDNAEAGEVEKMPF